MSLKGVSERGLPSKIDRSLPVEERGKSTQRTAECVLPATPLRSSNSSLAATTDRHATATEAPLRSPSGSAASVPEAAAALRSALDSAPAAVADAGLAAAVEEPAAALVAHLSGEAARAVPQLLALGEVLKHAYEIVAAGLGAFDIDAAWKSWGDLFQSVESAVLSVDTTQDPEAAAAIQSLKEIDARRYFVDVARDQWQYYADNVNVSSNFLAPDNVTLGSGEPKVDHRTSPTNIGLYMQSTMIATKLGIISQAQALGRLRETVDTIKKLPKWEIKDAQGNVTTSHLYNWYSTDGEPKEIGNGFVSTVDNGNFVADVMGVITAIGDADPALTRDLVDIVDKARFDCLYDGNEGLLYHGAHVLADGSVSYTGGHYDMVISEARSAYWAAIAKREIPEAAWTNLKPKLDKEIDDLNVIPELEFQSYYGTMFEYMAHSSAMRLEGTPLGKADEEAVRLQMKDTVGGLSFRSESNSNTPEGYAAHGSALLALSKQFISQGHDVFAPYACQLAASLVPVEVADILRKEEAVGLRSRVGFMESCTVKKKNDGTFDYDITPQVYAHHTGWGLRAMANCLLNGGITDWLHNSRYNKGQKLEKLLRTPVDQYRKPEARKAALSAGPDGAYGAGPEGAYGDRVPRSPGSAVAAKAFLHKVTGLLKAVSPKGVSAKQRTELAGAIEKFAGRLDPPTSARLVEEIGNLIRRPTSTRKPEAPSWIARGVDCPVSAEELTEQLGASRAAAPNTVGVVQEIIDRIKVEGILAGMSNAEKAQQMSTYTWSGMVTGPTGGSANDIQTTIARGAGALFNVTTADDANRLQDIAKTAGNEAPLLLGFDAISGFKTAGPIPLLQGCSFNPQVARSVAQLAATEAYLHGNRQVFAPMVDDSKSGPLWGRWVETYGAGSFLIGINAVMAAKGFKMGGLQTTAKHLVGYGHCDTDYTSADMNMRTIDELLLPYRLLIESGYLDWVMPGFNAVKGKPCTENAWLLKDVLRDQLGADVGIVSDYNAVAETKTYGTAKEPRQAAVDAVMAGVDMCMEDGSFANFLPQAVEDGAVPQHVLDDAARHILSLKAKAGLLDDGGARSDPTKADAFCLSDTARKVVYWAAVQSMVLLENKNGDGGRPVLPLAADAKKIALIGPMVKDRDSPMGQWKADAKADDTISVWDAFDKGTLDGQSLLYAKGCNVIGSDELHDLDAAQRKSTAAEEAKMLADALDAAAKSDVVVVTLGTTRDMSGEARSRSNPNLPRTQIKLVQQLKEKTNKPVVVVIETGLPVTGLAALQESADAVLWAGHGGAEIGNAVRNIIYGDENPSGHLAFDWSENPADYASDRFDRLRTGRPASENEKVTNAYIVARKDEALDKDGAMTRLDHLTPGRGVWVAGHGLSYTTFALSNLVAPTKLTKEEIIANGGVTVKATVSNTGDRTGEEVVQVYLSDTASSEVQPEKVLAGFEKVSLEPGETKTVSITIPSERFMSYSQQKDEQVFEAGEFKLWAAQDSRDISNEATLNVSE